MLCRLAGIFSCNYFTDSGHNKPHSHRCLDVRKKRKIDANYFIDANAQINLGYEGLMLVCGKVGKSAVHYASRWLEFY